MSLNFSIQLFCAVLASGSLLLLSLPDKEQDRYDRRLFWIASLLLIVFAAFRSLGVGMDDWEGYATLLPDMACPTFECGQWIQGERDQGWYSIVGVLKSFHPHPQVVLWLAGLGLAVKLWVIDRLCRYRSLALLFYVACFYLIHDITALRVSLAISVYLLGFYWLAQGRFRSGAWLLAPNGFFHQQAFVAPLLLLGQWLPLTSRRVQLGLLLPLVLLVMGVYPGDAILNWLMSLDWGRRVIGILFHGYENGKVAGVYDHTRLWPVVAPPTLFLSAWLLPDLSGRLRLLFQYTATSLIVAALFLWGYAVIPDVQLRFWHFFLVPIVFVIGNIRLTRWKLIAILALSTVYLLKYTVMHDLLLDQRQVYWESPVGGQIALQAPAIACGDGCGFNVTQGTVATLQATPEAGYRFAGWSGACAGAEPVCAVTVEDDLSVGAQFVKTVAVSVQWTGSGTLAAAGQAPCNAAACDWHPDVGSELALTAIPDEGWRFAGWGGACAGGEVHCVLKAEADQAVTAAFVQVFPVHLVIGPGGSVEGQPEKDCAAGCDWVVDAGTELSLQAAPAAGHRFVGWTGACEGQGVRCSVKANAAVTAEAKFVQLIPVHLVTGQGGTVEGLPGAVGDCAVGCDLSVDAGVELTLQAVPAPSHRFGGWSGGCEGQAARCGVKPEAAVTLGAKFVPMHTVDSVAAELGRVMAETPPASSAAPGPWVVDEGAVLPLTPVAKPGARFDHWTAGCVGTGLCPLTVTQDLTISAAFRALPAYPLRLTVRGQGQVSSEPAGLACGPPGSAGSCRGVFSEVTVRAEPAAGFVFRRWVGCPAGSHPVCATTLNRAAALTAEFVPVHRHEVKLAVTGPGAVQGLVDGTRCTKGARACRAQVMQGSEVTLTAVPEEGHFFIGWSGACAGREVTCKVPVGGAVGVGASFQ